MSDVGYEMKKTVNEAIEEYNKYRIPEVKAKLIFIDEASFHVEFKGSFCESCGFYDYFDDFSILLEDDYRLKTKIKEINEIAKGAVVKFEMVD